MVEKQHRVLIQTFQVILAGTFTGVQGDISCKVFDGPFHSKITWAGTGLIEGCNRRKCLLIFVRWNEVHTGKVSDVCNWIQFGRDWDTWIFNLYKLKWCKERIWLWGKMGRQNSTSKLNLIGCWFFFTFVKKSPGYCKGGFPLFAETTCSELASTR